MNWLIEYKGEYHQVDLIFNESRIVEWNMERVRLTADRIEKKPTKDETGWGFVLVESISPITGKYIEYSHNPTCIAKIL